MWGSAFGDPLVTLLAPAGYVFWVAAYSPDGSRIVTGSDPHGRPIAGWEDTLAMPDLVGKRVVVPSPGDA